MKLMKTVILAFSLLGTTALQANPAEYRVNIDAVNHLRGQSIETGSRSVWSNQTDQAVSLTFGSNGRIGRVNLQQPEGAEDFTREIAPGDSIDLTFPLAGFYRFALTFADGDIKSGDLAVAVPEVITIDIVGVTFSPNQIRVKAGQRIRWINTTSMVHTVTADPTLALDPNNVLLPDGAAPFDSGEVGPGETFVMEFTVPGEYKYFCKPHERMGHVGSIVVE